MNTQFSTVASLSFYAWLDNLLLQKGQAYTNYSSRLYYQPDPQIGTGYVAYAAPFKSFVWDSGVTGANILQTVSGSAGIINRGSGMMVDYENGRVLLNAGIGKNAIVSGTYAFKDFNVYFGNQTQERMVFTNKYYLNSRFNRPITGIPPAYDMVTPCIFITAAVDENKPWAFGGVYNTNITFSVNILAENQSQLQGALSLFSDSKDVCFPQLNTTLWPLNSFGDYKSGYNYEYLKNQYGTPSNLFTITKVRASAVSDYAQIDQAIWLGYATFTVEKPRFIH